MSSLQIRPFFLASSMAAPTERFHVLSQLDHLQSKYTGTGHADTTRWEWLVNQHRDTYASMIGKLLLEDLII